MEYVVGIDQGGKFYKILSTYPRIFMQTWVFIMVKYETPGCVYNFRPKKIIKEGKINGKSTNK